MDKVKKLPDGLLIMGDSICRLDPVFGQGMSKAILEALALKELLHGPNQSFRKIITQFYKQSAKIISPIWNMVITEDFRYRETMGKKPIGLSFQQWYAKNIFILSSKNQEIYDSFIRVMNLISPASILMKPKILRSVFLRSIYKSKNQ
ncbi:hypothetical protein [Neobacillus endophyticus]|uniref:hypothetical protein n=1 Tax=Neobacillus endophyticus TaxID=2738405 RepID=UPI001FED1C6C|nr:hypothetical protein [Neobacillus endophyticus]